MVYYNGALEPDNSVPTRISSVRVLVIYPEQSCLIVVLTIPFTVYAGC